MTGSDSDGSDGGAGPCLPEELRARLQKLTDDPPPEKLAPGAMCYSIGMPPMREEYICPECGERTLYATGRECANVVDVRVARELVTTLGREDVFIDESSFCRHCAPETAGPSLSLVIRYANGTEQRTANVQAVDVQLVKEFFDGQGKHDVGMGGDVPLKNHVARLATLLLPSEMAEEFRATDSVLGKLKHVIQKVLGGD